MKHASTNRKFIMLLLVLVVPACIYLVQKGIVDSRVAGACALGTVALLIVNFWDIAQEALARSDERVENARELLEEGKIVAANECLDMAVALNPANFEAIVVRGDAFRADRQFEEAYAEIQKALAIDPNSFTAHYALGLTYSQERKYEPSIDEFKRAIELNPDFCESYYQLAFAFDQLGEKDNALATYRKFSDMVTSEELRRKKIAEFVERTTIRIRVLS